MVGQAGSNSLNGRVFQQRIAFDHADECLSEPFRLNSEMFAIDIFKGISSLVVIRMSKVGIPGNVGLGSFFFFMRGVSEQSVSEPG